MQKKKRIEIDMDELIGQTYFAIAKWHNNDDKLDAEQMKTRLMGVSKEVIENVLNSVFQDKEKGTEYKSSTVQDTGLLSGLNIDFDSIREGKK